MKEGSLRLKIKGKDDLNQYIQRITYTEAVGELDGMTASFYVPASEAKKLSSLMEPGLPFEVDIIGEEGKVVNTREGDVVAVNHERRGAMWTVTLVGLNYLHRLRSQHVTQL